MDQRRRFGEAVKQQFAGSAAFGRRASGQRAGQPGIEATGNLSQTDIE